MVNAMFEVLLVAFVALLIAPVLAPRQTGNHKPPTTEGGGDPPSPRKP